MNDASKKPSVSTNEKNMPSASQEPWRPFDTLRRQVDRLFDDFERPWHLPFSRHGLENPAPVAGWPQSDAGDGRCREGKLVRDHSRTARTG